eukprot:6489255-Amphidinium_carterae.5
MQVGMRCNALVIWGNDVRSGASSLARCVAMRLMVYSYSAVLPPPVSNACWRSAAGTRLSLTVTSCIVVASVSRLVGAMSAGAARESPWSLGIRRHMERGTRMRCSRWMVHVIIVGACLLGNGLRNLLYGGILSMLNAKLSASKMDRCGVALYCCGDLLVMCAAGGLFTSGCLVCRSLAQQFARCALVIVGFDIELNGSKLINVVLIVEWDFNALLLAVSFLTV